MPKKSCSILLIDDSPEITGVVSLILKNAGHDVTISHTGEPLLILQKQELQPDIIILDVLLSGADGRELCRRIKNNALTKHIPVLMFSAYPQVADSVYQVGADAFLAKPFGRQSLLEAIENLCPKKTKN